MKRISRKMGWALSLPALFIWPVLDFLVSEMVLHTGCDYLHLGMYKILLNIWFYCLIEGIILALTLNIRIAIEGGAVGMGIFTAANVYLMAFRQIPLYMTDLVDIGTAAEVAGAYDFGLTKELIWLLIFVIATFIIGHLIWPFGRKYILRFRWLWRLVLIPVVTACTLWTAWFMLYSPNPKWHGVQISAFRPIKSYQANGAILTFMRSSNNLIVKKPDNYSKQEVEELDARYPSDEAKAQSVPNLIVIMNEAFSDLQEVGDFDTNQAVMPFIDSLEEDTIKGDLYVSVFGGHTANTEYEFLTGDSFGLCPTGTPYVLYIKNQMAGLTTYMEDLGSAGNITMHPNAASNYNRAKVYQHFGFDTFLTEGDFGECERVRGHVSDRADFTRIIEEYEQVRSQSDEPFYLFNVTMQNHSPYDSGDDNLPQEIKITTDGVADRESAERYLNLVHLSDAAVGELVEYFAAVDEPTMIVMFGDHEPGLSDAFYDSILPKLRAEMSDEEEMDLYKTAFFIWANFDIEEEEDAKISANYLQTAIKEAADLPMTGYDKFLADLREDLPLFTGQGYYDKDGQYYRVKNRKSPYWEKVNQYWTLVYNHLFDRENRANMFTLLKAQGQ